jgi:HSP20 family protein
MNNLHVKGGYMDSLTRWDPFREMWTLRNAMDRLFDNALTSSFDWPQSESLSLPLDVVENGDEYVVKASIPGINPDDLEITFTNDTLTIKGEVKKEEETENARYHLRERRYGSFSRSMTLPSGVKANDIHANYEAGILTLHLPKAEEVKPKRIPIHTQKMIEGKVR